MADQQPRGRNSEGVVVIRHPRTDFPQFGWIRAVLGTIYDPTLGYGWFSESACIRPYEKLALYGSRRNPTRDFYQTEPQQGWLITSNAPAFYNPASGYGWYAGTQSARAAAGPRYQRDTNHVPGWFAPTLQAIFNPARNDWQIQSLRNVRNRSLYLDGEKKPIGNNGWGIFTAPVFDPATMPWAINSQRIAHKPYWTSDPIDTDWLNPSITDLFNPAAYGWTIESHLTPKYAYQQPPCWTKSSGFITLLYDFDITLRDWTASSQLVPAPPYWTSGWTGTDWITPEVRATFNPVTQMPWSVDSQRVPSPPYWNSAWTGNDWLSPSLLAEIAHNPAIADWTIQTNTYQSRAWWSDSPEPIGWLVPSAQFDSTLWPAIPISSHRHWAKAVGRWQPDLDNAWLTENPVVPNTFNASFAMDTNDLVEPGSKLIHPGDSPGHA